MCPCNYGRFGAGLLAWCVYRIWLVGGLRAFIALVVAGDGVAVFFAVLTGLALLMLWHGVSAARAHLHMIEGPGVLWSAGVVGLAAYALSHGWFLHGGAAEFHISRSCWWVLLSSNAFNLWVQLRGLVPRRAPVVIEARPSSPVRTVWRRLQVREAVYEAVEQRPADPPARVPPPLPALEESAPPQIVHVPDESGTFVPLERVPQRVRR
ncbi:MAG: hypothetical protein ACREET_16895 [Stellaceae bacterium]